MPNLQQQIETARVQVHTDSYPMSIGELVNLYEDGEVDIHPEFQRVFRWTDEQKSKLIESILLGIPLPSIFVAQRKDGIWDVVDGLQRISTILSFLGKLKNEDGATLPPLVLKATKYLPSLEGKVWESDDKTIEIDIEIKRVFKREKLDIKIIKKESEGDTKYELFQRLNTGGTKLSDQEVRNCMLLMLNSGAYHWLKDLANLPDFGATTPISEKQTEECYAQELCLRFFALRHTNQEARKSHSDVRPYLDSEVSRLFSDDSGFDYEFEKDIYEKTFSILNEVLGENAFRKFNVEKDKYEGAISVLVFEALSSGLSKLIEENTKTHDQLCASISKASKALPSHEKFIDTLDRRVRPMDRMVIMKELGTELLSEG